MARELQALQADLFRSGDLVECHVLLASTLLAEKAEKKWLPGEIVGTKESAWNIGRVQYEVLLDIDDVATNGGVRRTVDAEDVRCAFKNGYKWCAAAEHLVLHEPNVGDCVLARYRFEQGNVSGVVWEAGEIKQVHDKRPLSATAHTRYRYTIQYHDGCMDSEVRRQNIMGLESKDGQDYMKSKALRMKLESFRARRSSDAALSSQASPVRQASPSSAACGATAAGAGFNDAAHAILATQVTGPHESGFTLPTKRKRILLDDMEPGLRANKIVKGDAWLGGTSLAEASRQWLQIVDASRWIGRGAGSPSAGAKEVDGAKTAQASQAGAECDRGDAQEPCSPASVQLCVGESLLGGSRNGEAMEPEIDNHKARTDGAAERERSWCPLSGVGSDEVLGHPAAESAGASWHGNLNESGDDDKEENGLGELESGMVKDEWEDRRGKEADDGSDREIEVDRKKSGSVTNDEEEGVEAVAAEEEGDTMMDADHRKSDLIVRGAGGCQQTPVCPHCGRDFSSMHPNARAGCMAVHVKACAAKVSFRAACWECREKHYSRKQCREVYRHKGPDWIHDDRNVEEGEAVEADGNNDDCELCGMGDDDAEKGELICCDFCECVYHSSCLDKRVEDLPEEYRCPKCCGTLAEVQADYARRQQKRESMATGVIPGGRTKGVYWIGDRKAKPWRAKRGNDHIGYYETQDEAKQALLRAMEPASNMENLAQTPGPKVDESQKLSQYNHFVKSMVHKLKNENPSCLQQDRMKQIGQLWSAMSVDERKSFCAPTHMPDHGGKPKKVNRSLDDCEACLGKHRPHTCGRSGMNRTSVSEMFKTICWDCKNARANYSFKHCRELKRHTECDWRDHVSARSERCDFRDSGAASVASISCPDEDAIAKDLGVQGAAATARETVAENAAALKASGRAVDAESHCSVCTEEFGAIGSQKEAVKLKCEHTFCRECMQMWASGMGKVKGFGMDKGFSCPLCRLTSTKRPSHLPVDKVRSAPVATADAIASNHGAHSRHVICQATSDKEPISAEPLLAKQHASVVKAVANSQFGASSKMMEQDHCPGAEKAICSLNGFMGKCWECKFGKFSKRMNSAERCRGPSDVLLNHSKKRGLAHTGCDYWDDERFTGDRVAAQRLSSVSLAAKKRGRAHARCDLWEQDQVSGNVVVAKNEGQQVHSSNEVQSMVGRQVSKNFPGHGVFSGQITRHFRGSYHVKYTDDDEESMSYEEVLQILVPLTECNGTCPFCQNRYTSDFLAPRKEIDSRSYHTHIDSKCGEKEYAESRNLEQHRNRGQEIVPEKGAKGVQKDSMDDEILCPHCGRDFSSMHPNARAGCMAVHVKACAAKVSFRAACWECREKHYSRKQCREVYRHKGPDWIHDDRNMEEGEAVEADGNNDDCELCGMGDDDAEKGELICCDFCECVYHSSCLDKRVEDLPEEYRCPKCCGTLAEVQADYARRQQKRESMATGVIPGDPVKGKPARPSTETTSLGVSDDDFQIGDKKEVLGSVAEYYDDGESINTVYGPRNGEQQDQRDGINFQSLCWECRFGEYARFKPTFERCRLPFWNVVCESSKTVTKKYGLGHTDCDYFEDERFNGDRHTEKDRVLDFSFSGNELAVADTLHSLVLNAPDGQMATSKLCQVLYTLCADAKSVVKGHGGLKSFTETKLLEHAVEFVPDKGGGKVVTRKAGCRAGAGAAEPAARLDLSPDPLQSPSQKEREQSKHAGFDADSQRKGLEECLGKSLPRKSDELVMNSTDRNMVIDCDKKGNTEAGAMQVDEGTVDTTWEALRRRKEREHERDEGREFVGVVQTCKWSRTSSGISGFFFVYGSGLPSCGIWCGANGYAYWIIRLISGKSSAEISSLPMKDVRSILDGVLIQSEVRGNVDKLEPVQGKSPAARRFRMTGLLAMLTTEQRHRLELLQNEADFPVGLRCEDARDREKNEKFRRVESKYVLATFSPEVAPLLARCELAVDDFWGASGSGRREEADSYFDEEIMVAVKSLPACDAVTVECITRGQIPSGKTEYDVHANKDFVQVVRDSLKDFLKKDMSLVRDARRFFESIMRRKLTECAGKKNVMLHQGRGREGVAESGGEFSVEDKEKGADTACAGWLLVENEFICRMQAHPICDFPDEMRMRGCSLYAQDPAIRDAGRLETLVTVGEWEVRLEGALAKNEENVVLSLIDSLRAKRFVPLTVRGHSFLSLC